MYRPHPVHSPMLEQAGDLHVAGTVAVQGGQVSAAWAASDRLGLRADLQADAHTGPYGVARVGAGWFRASPEGLRLALWADAGGGYGESSHTVTIHSSTTGDTTSETHLSGLLAQGSASAELGWEGDISAVGLELRSVTELLWHDAGSDEAGTGWLTTAELLALARVGGEAWRLQAFAGLSLPYAGDGTTGVPLPLLLGLGVTWDLPRSPAGGR